MKLFGDYLYHIRTRDPEKTPDEAFTRAVSNMLDDLARAVDSLARDEDNKS